MPAKFIPVVTTTPWALPSVRAVTAWTKVGVRTFWTPEPRPSTPYCPDPQTYTFPDDVRAKVCRAASASSTTSWQFRAVTTRGVWLTVHSTTVLELGQAASVPGC